jgi:hypothetical protein
MSWGYIAVAVVSTAVSANRTNKAAKDAAGAQGRAQKAIDDAEAAAKEGAATFAGAEATKRKRAARASSLLSETDPLSGAKKTLLGE